MPDKPKYTAKEVGALPANTPVPTNLSDLSNVDNTNPIDGQVLIYDALKHK